MLSPGREAASLNKQHVQLVSDVFFFFRVCVCVYVAVQVMHHLCGTNMYNLQVFVLVVVYDFFIYFLLSQLKGQEPLWHWQVTVLVLPADAFCRTTRFIRFRFSTHYFQPSVMSQSAPIRQWFAQPDLWLRPPQDKLLLSALTNMQNDQAFSRRL